MNPQVPKVLQEKCEQDPETGKEKTGIISSTVKSLTAIALACTLSGIPQKGEAQEVTQTVFKTETTLVSSGESLTEMQKESRFVDAINALPEEGQTELIPGLTIIQALESFGTNDEFLNKAIGYFILGFSVDKAILKVYYDNFFDTLEGANNQADIMRALHSEAIALGEEEYVLNALALHPRYNTGRLAKLSVEEKRVKAAESYHFFIDNFFNGIPTNGESYDEFVSYNPGLAGYLVKLEKNFNPEVVGNLKSTIRLLKATEKLAQSQAELAQSQAELRAALGRLADTMINAGVGS